jgi:tetratricopeptide (TPR) repeat protein
MSTAPESHVTDVEIERLIAGTIAPDERRRAVQHLLQCPGCRERKRPFLAALGAVLHERVPERPLPEAAYETAWEAATVTARRWAKRWEGETRWRERLVAAAQGAPPFRIEMSSLSRLFRGLVRRAPGLAIVEALLALSQQERYRDPKAMEDLAFAAVARAMSLGSRSVDRGRYSALQRSDLQVRALGELANAQRLNHDIETADETLCLAWERLEEEGSGEPLLAARLLDIWASLFLDQRRLGPAFDLLDRVHKRYLNMGETHLAGRALISKGMGAIYEERPKAAADLFREGLDLIDAKREPQLAMSAQHNLLKALIDSEQFREARNHLFQSGLRQAFAEDPLNRLKLRWLEGKIYFGLGNDEQAETLFRDTRAEFARRGRYYVAAMLDLELTAVYLRRGQAAAAEAEATRALEVFKSLGVSYEAARAVHHLQEACRKRVATAALASRVVRYLQQLETKPTLRFTP